MAIGAARLEPSAAVRLLDDAARDPPEIGTLRLVHLMPGGAICAKRTLYWMGRSLHLWLAYQGRWATAAIPTLCWYNLIGSRPYAIDRPRELLCEPLIGEVLDMAPKEHHPSLHQDVDLSAGPAHPQALEIRLDSSQEDRAATRVANHSQAVVIALHADTVDVLCWS